MIRNTSFLAGPPAKQRKTGRGDKRHLGFVASLPCCICGLNDTIQVHHLLRGVDHGMGKRAEDKWTIPLCYLHHAQLHADGDETRYLSRRNIDGKALAADLFSFTGDRDAAMVTIAAMRHRGAE